MVWCGSRRDSDFSFLYIKYLGQCILQVRTILGVDLNWLTGCLNIYGAEDITGAHQSKEERLPPKVEIFGRESSKSLEDIGGKTPGLVSIYIKLYTR